MDGGLDIEQSVAFAQAMEGKGCDAIHVSSGGLSPAQSIPISPSYQVPLARTIKAAVNIPVVAVGLITEPTQAETIVATGDADLVALARAIYSTIRAGHGMQRRNLAGRSPHRTNIFGRSRPSIRACSRHAREKAPFLSKVIGPPLR